MAIEIYPDSPSLGMSPRISFSHDLSQSDVVPVEQYICNGSSQPSISISAFSGRASINSRPPPTNSSSTARSSQSKSRNASRRRENPNSESEEKQKSFWRFKRSSSLNCGSGYGRTLCPLPLLSRRSNSTGSAASSGKRSSSVSNNQKQSFLRHNSSNTSQKLPQTGYSSRPPLKKNSHGSYSNGVRFNPVLHVPSANLFGLGSIFSGGKDRSKKK
ncbi:hypothetical protein DH2020_037755 [Rehmannia glutinosa]|uniref:Uncharacterized protein n=1 Tax=Rehmannia glutinosa TaxID=99300 RepID=A0ABR0V1P0_REHGL